jgi:hypothetical protein
MLLSEDVEEENEHLQLSLSNENHIQDVIINDTALSPTNLRQFTK